MCGKGNEVEAQEAEQAQEVPITTANKWEHLGTKIFLQYTGKNFFKPLVFQTKH